MVSLSVNGNISIVLIIWRMLGPPESVVDRVLINSFLLCRYHHLSLQGTGYGSVSCQPLTKAHTVQRGYGGRYRMHPVGMPPGPGAWVFPVGTERGAPLRARDINLIPCYVEVVASPLRVWLDWCCG